MQDSSIPNTKEGSWSHRNYHYWDTTITLIGQNISLIALVKPWLYHKML